MGSDDPMSADESGSAAVNQTLMLRLYITRGATNSIHALANLKDICEQHFADRCDLEVIDILQDPRRVFADGVLLTPTLVKLAPLPQTIIVGDLSQTDRVVRTLRSLAGGPVP
jgi:circadian clock protein KaiB